MWLPSDLVSYDLQASMHELLFYGCMGREIERLCLLFKIHFGGYFQQQQEKIGTIGSLREFIAAICDSEDLSLNFIDADVCRQLQDKQNFHTYVSITLSKIWFNLYFQDIPSAI